MVEQKEGCVKPSRGPIGIPKAETGEATQSSQKEGIVMMAKVGKPAPDFEASAYADGGFKNITLSEFKGQWVVLCFYPGDFTFV
jgi:peroxiredoxin (alkyl hydroperoxide reductase subunit C)